MTATNAIPTAILSRQLGDAIAGRRVRVAVFTTFTFDPGFFELHVLPILFDQSFSQVDKVKRIQLEDAIADVDDIAVYYDQAALAQDGEPASLDYRRIGIRRRTGCFHPKVITLLVDELAEDDAEDEAPHQALIVAVLSANLTRAGWWENVECAQIEEIKDVERDSKRSSFRRELLTLLRRIRDDGRTDDDHTALDAIRTFLKTRTQRRRFQQVSAGGRYFTQIFCGQQRISFTDWLVELGLDRYRWNLEVISPFFDPHGAGPLDELIERLEPKETRVYLPCDEQGTAQVSRETYAAVSDVAAWSHLPGELMNRGRATSSERLPPRRVHAKVYRLWSKPGNDLLIVGSVNLTGAGHSHAAAGNLEAAMLVDVTDAGYQRRWWLEPVEREVEHFSDRTPAEDEGLDAPGLNLVLRYDWGTDELSYRLIGGGRPGFEVCESSGGRLFTVTRPVRDKWVRCPPEGADQVRALLAASSFLLIRHKDKAWRILVREENMGHRPSLLMQLTPEEILEYWALLTPEQRAAFIEARVGTESDLEGIPVAARRALVSRNTLFDRFAGVYHSFGCLRRFVKTAIEEGRDRDAEARLLGAKYDSLPSLLEKTLERQDGDPILRYVTFLSARQLRDAVRREQPEFIRSVKKRAGHLDQLLKRVDDVRGDVPLEDGEFLDWFESAFLRELSRRT